MENMADIIQKNPTIMYYLVGGSLGLFLLGFILLKVLAAGKKKKLRGQGSLGEIVFNQTVRPASQFATDVQFVGYKIYSVNGGQPKVVDKSIFVPQGLCEIELEFLDTEYGGRHNSITTKYGKKTLQIDVESGQKYRVSFDDKAESFVVT